MNVCDGAARAFAHCPTHALEAIILGFAIPTAIGLLAAAAQWRGWL